MELLTKDLNWYDLYRPLYPSGISSSDHAEKQEEIRNNRYKTVVIDGEEKTYKRGYTMGEYTPWIPFLKNQENPVILGDYLTDYMNQPETRTAFNIPTSVQAWEMCSGTLEYQE